MIAERSDPASQPDSVFVDHVRASAASVKLRGAAYVLMVHMFESEIRDYVTLPIDDLVTAYRRQMRGWPKRARNTKIPTLWFVDLRDHPEAASAGVVADLEVPLEAISGLRADAVPGADGPASRKITMEVERRLKQQVLRVRVGERYGWRCAVTGTAVRDALDAAHLPGRDWRVANQASDGVLLRADLHRAPGPWNCGDPRRQVRDRRRGAGRRVRGVRRQPHPAVTRPGPVLSTGQPPTGFRFHMHVGKAAIHDPLPPARRCRRGASVGCSEIDRRQSSMMNWPAPAAQRPAGNSRASSATASSCRPASSRWRETLSDPSSFMTCSSATMNSAPILHLHESVGFATPSACTHSPLSRLPSGSIR